MAYFDLEPDGRIVPNDSFGLPTGSFDAVPAPAERRGRGQERLEGAGYPPGQAHRLTGAAGAAGPAADECLFDGDRHSSWDRIYKMTARDHYVFDVRKGVVKRVDNENTQGYGFNGKGTGDDDARLAGTTGARSSQGARAGSQSTTSRRIRSIKTSSPVRARRKRTWMPCSRRQRRP